MWATPDPNGKAGADQRAAHKVLFSESIRTHCVQRPWQPSQKCRWWDKDAGPPPNVFFCRGYCHRRRQDSFVKGSSQLSFQGSPDCVFIRQEPLQV